MKPHVGAMLAMFAASTLSHAATILDVTGPSPFGFANQGVLVQAWNQAATYSNVAIAMALEDNSNGGPISGIEGTVYLTNQIGPGTTTANQVAPPVTVSGLTASFTTRTLFSGLALQPGNYYVVLVSANTNPLSMSPEGSSTPAATVGNGVTAIGAGAALTPAAYPPATGVTLNPPGNLFVTVTGDLVPSASTPVPTLDVWAMLALTAALAVAGSLALRRARA